MSRAPRWYRLHLSSYLLAVLVLACFAGLQMRVWQDGQVIPQGWPWIWHKPVGFSQKDDHRLAELAAVLPSRLLGTWRLLSRRKFTNGFQYFFYFNPRNLVLNSLIGLGIAALTAGCWSGGSGGGGGEWTGS